MHSPRRLLTLFASIIAIAGFVLPTGALGATSAQCSWDASTGTLTAVQEPRFFQVSTYRVPCVNAPINRAEADATSLPLWEDVRILRMHIGGGAPTGDGSASVGELDLTGWDLSRDVELRVESVDPEAAKDFMVRLQYDSQRNLSSSRTRIEVASNGLDVDSDGTVEVVMPEGLNYALDVRSKSRPVRLDLRTLPAGANQTVRIEAAQSAGAIPNRVWGPRTGAGVLYLGGKRRNIIDTYQGDDAISTWLGNDIIRTRGGEDTIDASGGNDRIWSGPGGDYVEAGAGNDLVILGPGDNYGGGGGGNDIIRGGPGRDRISASGRLNIRTYGGSDQVELSATRGGFVDCGAGLDFRDYIYDPNRLGRSCDRYTGKRLVNPPVIFDWRTFTWRYRCANIWAFREYCRDPRIA